MADDGVSLARALISKSDAEVTAAQTALRSAPPNVVTSTGKELASVLRRGDKRSRLAAVESIHDVPEVWFNSGAYEAVITALANAIEDGGKVGSRAQQANLKVLTAMAGGSVPENDRDAREEDDRDARVPIASANIASRVLSVATQVWVIAIGGLILLFAIPALFVAPQRPLILAGLAGAFALFVLIDAFKRRCRSCRKLLAAQRVRSVKTNHGHRVSWRCVLCAESWRTTHYS